MRRVLLILLVFIGVVCNAQDRVRVPDKKDVINLIQERCKSINANAKNYIVKQVSVDTVSTEGAEVTGYYEQSDLRKMNCRIYGCSYRLLMECYFEKGVLVFAYYKKEHYSSSIADVNMKIASVDESRYYFDKGKLIRWTDNGKAKAQDAVFIEEDENVVGDISKYVQLLKV